MTRVLVVDDEPQLLRALRINLAARSYDVVTAADGHQALAAAAKALPDIVVLDLGLPDMDGIEVIRGLRGWTAVPIIILSGRSLTIGQVEQYGVDRLLDKLAVALREGSYRPLAARRVWIPKPGSTEQRPLSIPTVADRIVQAAVKIVLEPIFEADMLDCSFGFRPRRAAHDALQVVVDQSWQGRRWVVETDIANCFSAIPHSGLMSAVKERICDRRLLRLLGAFVHAGVMQDGSVRRPVSGTPQGGVLSPVLCNVYLHRLDRAWRGAYGRLVRYADDLLVVCRSRGQAQAALARLRALLADLGLEPKAAKTRIVHLVEGGEGFDFLGFHHRLVRSRPQRGSGGLVYLARWPPARRRSTPETASGI
jgi:group II intron reverse transcriptase/maturase